MKPDTIFLRKASGLAKDWSITDFAMYVSLYPLVWPVYVAAFAAFWVSANFILGWILVFIFGTVQAVMYAGMTSAMPRAGGDYIFQTRTFGPFKIVGYVLNFVVYAFGFPMSLILICVPLVWRFITPLALLSGVAYESIVWWLSGTGLFVSFVIQLAIGLVVTCLGLKWIGRLQKVVWSVATIATLAVPVCFLFTSKEFFATNFNAFYHDVIGTQSASVFQETVQAATDLGWAGVFNWNIVENLPMMALMAMGAAWFTQGNPLGGEARGASSFKKAFLAYEIGALWMVLGSVVVMWPILNLVGFDFFQSANFLFWMGDAHAPIFPETTLWVYFATGNKLLTYIILGVGMLITWWTNIFINGFLLCSRPLFGMAFDRMLPSAFARISTRFRLPLIAYAYVTVAALVFGLLYAFDIGNFVALTLDVLAITLVVFLGTALAALVLPYVRRNLYESSPISKYTWGKLNLLSISGLIVTIYFAIILYYWATDARYGVNSLYSMEFLSLFFILAIIIYVAYKYYNKKRGVDINLTYGEIPAE